MFIDFFYKLKENNVPVSVTSFLILHHAVSKNLVFSLKDFYVVSRCILIKSEKYFDVFDKIFFSFFGGMQVNFGSGEEFDKIVSIINSEWLALYDEIREEEKTYHSFLKKMSSKELLEYFKKILEKQSERHQGGGKWIGTKGVSPLGHSGRRLGGMRIGGFSKNKSAIKIAMERRYKDYSSYGVFSEKMIGDGIKKIKNLVTLGPRDKLNIEKSIDLTVKNAGDISIHFDRRKKNLLTVFLLIDNGGWSMDPYVSVVKSLFEKSKFYFKNLKIYYFHNTIYEKVWADSERKKNGIKVEMLIKSSKDVRLIIVGDANMSPYELVSRYGSIYSNSQERIRSVKILEMLSKAFPYSVWLNPSPIEVWKFSQTIGIIGKIFPMFELSVEGIEKSVSYLNSA